jgi:hypothetical protein
LSKAYRLPDRPSLAARRRAQAAAPAVQEAPEAEATDYSSLLKGELVSEAEQRGIDSSGTKSDIIARLEASDD